MAGAHRVPRMPRYFFDHYANGQRTTDEEGVECADLSAVRLEAMRALPSIAKEEIASDGDRQAYSVHVVDEAGKPVYSATLTFAGLRLARDGE